ncbi:Variant-specific surface protein, partial [Giardia duodenalis]
VSDPAGVSIDSLCRPASSPQVIVAGCTGSDGAALTDASTACESCSGEFFLFRGGCYNTESTAGSEICTKAEGGKCATCKTDGSYIFQNRAATVTLGNECILCSDATNRDGVMGVANCNKCTHTSNTGAATCSACQDGYYKDGNGACQKCRADCATCGGTGQNACTSCPEGKYLKDTGCVDNTCGGGNTYYPDPVSGKCISCSAVDEGGIEGCTACKYNVTVSKPQCTACSSQKMIKTEVDGTTTCADAAGCATDNQAGSHFLNQAKNKCLLCSDITTDASGNGNKGVEHCKTCRKAANNQNPTCSACLDGYFYDSGSSTCKNCAANCATCTSNQIDTCIACFPGYFLKTDGSNKECVPCDNVDKGGIDGCAECSGTTGSLKCTKCKPNRRSKGESGNYTCEEKICEDETACGGTAGACGAIVVGGDGSVKYYCSQCRQ